MFHYLFLFQKKFINKLINSKSGGFTLVEVLVFLLIFSIIMSIIVVILFLPTRVSQTLSSDVELTQEIQNTVDKIISVLMLSKNATATNAFNPSNSEGIYITENNEIYLRKNEKNYKLAENMNVTFMVNHINSPPLLPKKIVSIELEKSKNKSYKKIKFYVPLMNSFNLTSGSTSTGANLIIDF